MQKIIQVQQRFKLKQFSTLKDDAMDPKISLNPISSYKRPFEDQAWCFELERIVTGAEVWELHFGKQRVNHALTFKCPDTACPARMTTRLCHQVSNPFDVRFRLLIHQYHRMGCSWLKQRQALVHPSNQPSRVPL
jgi:hypothetical protein